MHRILIADDSATIRKMVRASLQTLDQTQFLEAGTGLEAIEQLALAAVQLIVLDLNMPDMHGIDVLKFLRAQPALPRLAGHRPDHAGRRLEPRARGGSRRHHLHDQAVRARRRSRRRLSAVPAQSPRFLRAGPMTDELFAGFLDDYFAECEEHLTGAPARAARARVSGRSARAAAPVIDELFRASIRSRASRRWWSCGPAEDLAHGLEDYLRRGRERRALGHAGRHRACSSTATQLLERIVNARRAKHELPAIDDVLDRVSDSLPRAADAAALGGPSPGDADRRSERPGAPSAALEMLVRSDPRAARSRDRRRHHPAAALGNRHDRRSVSASSCPMRDQLHVHGRSRRQRGLRGRAAGRSGYGRDRRRAPAGGGPGRSRADAGSRR